ncbi:MAG TPA: SpoIID/LytB domain-containing protein [Nocardioidaceae bacterium]|nr:SpoIID/LytB domain-containing protein [Nocardioidaceae bacterium]
MFTNRHRALRSSLATVTATVTAAVLGIGLLWVPPAQAARLGSRPAVEMARHFQTSGFQRLDWSPVSGATSYQVFVKEARYDQSLPRNWRLLKTVNGTSTTVHVARGDTRQFGVRAVGRPAGTRMEVTAISNFGTVSRPARLRQLLRVRRWTTVRYNRFYGNVALESHRRRSKLRLPDAQGITTIWLIGEAGRRYGLVDVYVGQDRIRRVDFGRRRHDNDKQIRVRVRPRRSGTVSLITRGRKPVRISAIGTTRSSTTATRTPSAPLARPPAKSFTFRGSGWGHGVGLSQYGAKAMADAGKSMSQILQHYYRGTSLDRASDRLLNVNVRYHASSVNASLRALSPGAEAEVCAMRSGRCADRVTFRDRRAGSGTAGAIRVTRSSGDVLARVTRPNGDVTSLRGSQVRIRWTGTRYLAGDASVLRLGTGREYRHGKLFIDKHGSTQLNASIRMKLQSEYLRGVAEMPSSWNLDALRAQAVIARTYALKTGAGRKSDCDCHLRDSVVHQAYLGWGKENEGRDAYYGKRWVSAVDSTAGQVLRYRGALASTFYFSASGGHTLNSQDVWSSTVPYLQSVDDPWSLTRANPNRTWASTRSQSSMASLFGLRDIHSISITSTYRGGGVRSVTATATNGDTRTISGKADTMRIRLGLKAAWLTSIDETY